MRLRIVNHKRFMLSMTIIFTIFFFILLTIYGFINKVEGYEGEKYLKVCVEEGDTIWGIAREHTPVSIDIRKRIYEIEKINDLHNCEIRPGQIIKVPLE